MTPNFAAFSPVSFFGTFIQGTIYVYKYQMKSGFNGEAAH